MSNDEYKSLNFGDFEECNLERLFGVVDVERLNETIVKDAKVYRTEKLADSNDMESCYEVEYWARDYGAPNCEYEEIYLGNMSGENLIIKERSK